MRIAVSFDGTIVENKYPDIGKEKPNAIKTLRKLASEGNCLILWTARYGLHLNEAIEWCQDRGVEFYAVNCNRPVNEDNSGSRWKSPKIVADVFIDCHNIGGLPEWDEIYVKANELRDELHRKYKKEK